VPVGLEEIRNKLESEWYEPLKDPKVRNDFEKFLGLIKKVPDLGDMLYLAFDITPRLASIYSTKVSFVKPEEMRELIKVFLEELGGKIDKETIEELQENKSKFEQVKDLTEDAAFRDFAQRFMQEIFKPSAADFRTLFEFTSELAEVYTKPELRDAVLSEASRSLFSSLRGGKFALDPSEIPKLLELAKGPKGTAALGIARDLAEIGYNFEISHFENLEKIAEAPRALGIIKGLARMGINFDPYAGEEYVALASGISFEDIAPLLEELKARGSKTDSWSAYSLRRFASTDSISIAKQLLRSYEGTDLDHLASLTETIKEKGDPAVSLGIIDSIGQPITDENYFSFLEITPKREYLGVISKLKDLGYEFDLKKLVNQLEAFIWLGALKGPYVTEEFFQPKFIDFLNKVKRTFGVTISPPGAVHAMDAFKFGNISEMFSKESLAAFDKLKQLITSENIGFQEISNLPTLSRYLRALDWAIDLENEFKDYHFNVNHISNLAEMAGVPASFLLAKKLRASFNYEFNIRDADVLSALAKNPGKSIDMMKRMNKDWGIKTFRANDLRAAYVLTSIGREKAETLLEVGQEIKPFYADISGLVLSPSEELQKLAAKSPDKRNEALSTAKKLRDDVGYIFKIGDFDKLIDIAPKLGPELELARKLKTAGYNFNFGDLGEMRDYLATRYIELLEPFIIQKIRSRTPVITPDVNDLIKKSKVRGENWSDISDTLRLVAMSPTPPTELLEDLALTVKINFPEYSRSRTDIERLVPGLKRDIDTMLTNVGPEQEVAIREVVKYLPLAEADLVTKVRNEAIDLERANNMLGSFRQAVHNYPSPRNVEMMQAYISLLEGVEGADKKLSSVFEAMGIAGPDIEALKTNRQTLHEKTYELSNRLLADLRAIYEFNPEQLQEKARNWAGNLAAGPETKLARAKDAVSEFVAAYTSRDTLNVINTARKARSSLQEFREEALKASDAGLKQAGVDAFYLDLYIQRISNSAYAEAAAALSSVGEDNLQVAIKTMNSMIGSIKADLPNLPETEHLLTRLPEYMTKPQSVDQYVELRKATERVSHDIRRIIGAMEEKYGSALREKLGHKYSGISLKIAYEQAMSDFYRSTPLLHLDNVNTALTSYLKKLPIAEKGEKRMGELWQTMAFHLAGEKPWVREYVSGAGARALYGGEA